MRDYFIQGSYLAASVLFILGLRSLTRPDKARRGMQLAAAGMLFAIIGTLVSVPGDVSVTAAIGPRIYIPAQYVDETSLLMFGSRSERETLVKVPARSSIISFAATCSNPKRSKYFSPRRPSA